MTIFAYLPMAMSEQRSPYDAEPATYINEHNYSIPEGLSPVPAEQLDLRSDLEIDNELMKNSTITDEKNIFFYWHSGYEHMQPPMRRNIRGWHRRFSKQGWKIRVLNGVHGSPLNMENFLDINDCGHFPQAFRDDMITGTHAARLISVLIRWPLLLKYGGVYADPSLIQIGDLDGLWMKTIADPGSPYEIISFRARNMDGCHCDLAKYVIGCGRKNAFLMRCHKLLLQLWAGDGGKTSTQGTHQSPSLKNLGRIGGAYLVEDTESIMRPETFLQLLTDSTIPSQVAAMVAGSIGGKEHWDGPEYIRQHYYGIDIVDEARLMDIDARWNGQNAFGLMSLYLPRDDEPESEQQRQAREMVQECLQNSWVVELGHDHGVMGVGQTLGQLWMDNEGSDNVPGTYAHWFRYATTHWNRHLNSIEADNLTREPIYGILF